MPAQQPQEQSSTRETAFHPRSIRAPAAFAIVVWSFQVDGEWQYRPVIAPQRTPGCTVAAPHRRYCIAPRGAWSARPSLATGSRQPIPGSLRHRDNLDAAERSLSNLPYTSGSTPGSDQLLTNGDWSAAPGDVYPAILTFWNLSPKPLHLLPPLQTQRRKTRDETFSSL